MNLRFFIDRPVFSIVISVTIVLLGIIALTTLSVEQYPDIAPPTVQVTTSYPGANAETVQKAVIVPLEEAINGVENMSYIHSEASNTGEVTVNVYFRQGVDADMAAVNVQNRVSKAQGLLPAEVTKIGGQTLKQQKSLLKVVALYSPDDTYDMQFINNYMKINVEPRMKRIAGVGEFNVLASNYSMRIWLKPDVMAQYKLIPSDVTAALEKQNLESATGAFGENHANAYEYTIKWSGRLSTPEQFEQIVIRSLPNGDILRLKDIARVEMGDEAYTYRALTDGHAGCIGEAYQSGGVERHGGGGEHRRPHCRADRGVARRAGVRRPAERQPFPLRLDGKRPVDARRSDSAGRAGGLCLFAGHPFDADSDHRHRRLAGRHVRRHVAAGILDQPLNVVRPRAGHRYGGR